MLSSFELEYTESASGSMRVWVGLFTKVSSEVLPEPLGPTSRKEGRVVEDVER